MIGLGLGRHIISSPRAVRSVRGERCFELGESHWASRAVRSVRAARAGRAVRAARVVRAARYRGG